MRLMDLVSRASRSVGPGQGVCLFSGRLPSSSTLPGEADCAVFLREEDEYSELRSDLSQSQHEVNEDSRSVDQDQASVSVPENQSTVVTADVGECTQHAHPAGAWLQAYYRTPGAAGKPVLQS